MLETSLAPTPTTPDAISIYGFFTQLLVSVKETIKCFMAPIIMFDGSDLLSLVELLHDVADCRFCSCGKL